MQIGAMYSHLNGHEWIMYHHRAVWEEIEHLISSVDASKHMTKVSKEKTMAGELKYNPVDLNKEFSDRFKALSWWPSVTHYWVTDDHRLIQEIMNLGADAQKTEIKAKGKEPIRSYNQTDFVKDRIAVEVQFGKYSFIAYDLFVKHMAFFVGNKIDLGIEILPMKAMQAQMSSGPGYYEGALFDLVRQGRGVPAVPLIMIGIEP
jgi:hypothetical protein